MCSPSQLRRGPAPPSANCSRASRLPDEGGSVESGLLTLVSLPQPNATKTHPHRGCPRVTECERRLAPGQIRGGGATAPRPPRRPARTGPRCRSADLAPARGSPRAPRQDARASNPRADGNR
ncbi:hypothetical protein ACFPRL_07910 [Pseudoclavibacter helvolus]